MAQFSSLVGSVTADTYQTRLRAIQQDFSQYPNLLNYLINIWITPYASRFIRAFADQHLHFGNRVTSRIEGGHSTLKLYLQSSMRDLKMVLKKINLLLINQHTQHKATIGQARDKTQQRLMIPLFAE